MANICTAIRMSPVRAVNRTSGLVADLLKTSGPLPIRSPSGFQRAFPMATQYAAQPSRRVSGATTPSAAAWLEPFDFEHSRRVPTLARHQGMLSPAADMVDLTSRLFDEFADLTGVSKTASHAGFLTDVAETDTEYTLTGELPGMAEENVNIRLDGRNLIISAHVENETKEEAPSDLESKPRMLRVERHQRSFQRTFHLPKNVDAEGITASIDKGILSVSLPKMEEHKTATRTIPIGKPAAELKEAVDNGFKDESE